MRQKCLIDTLRTHEKKLKNTKEVKTLRLKVNLVDESGNEQHEWFASRREVHKPEKWSNAFKQLFEDALKEDADLEITIVRKKRNISVV